MVRSTRFARVFLVCSVFGLVLAATACTGVNPPQVPSQWTTLPAPSTLNFTDSDCVTPTACYAVTGGSDVHRWDGATWSTRSLAASGPGGARRFGTIDCFAVDQCLLAAMVGGAGDVPARASSLVRWTGDAVTEIPTTLGSGAGNASCTSLTWCMVWRSGAPQAYVWDGSTFTVAAPTLDVSLDATPACSAPTMCMAPAHRWFEPGIARWDGSTWTFEPVTATGGTFLSLPPAIDCPGPSFCAATAQLAPLTNPAMPAVAAVARWSGGSWTPFAPVAHPAGHVDLPYDMIYRPTCSSPDWCVALARETDGWSERLTTLIWTGTAWGYGAERPGSPAPVQTSRVARPAETLSCASGQRWCLATGTNGANALTPAPTS
jgi:hypothetical protein